MRQLSVGGALQAAAQGESSENERGAAIARIWRLRAGRTFLPSPTSPRVPYTIALAPRTSTMPTRSAAAEGRSAHRRCANRRGGRYGGGLGGRGGRSCGGGGARAAAGGGARSGRWRRWRRRPRSWWSEQAFLSPLTRGTGPAARRRWTTRRRRLRASARRPPPPSRAVTISATISGRAPAASRRASAAQGQVPWLRGVGGEARSRRAARGRRGGDGGQGGLGRAHGDNEDGEADLIARLNHK